MDALWFALGLLTASLANYYWFMIGRNTQYQDHNITPPPSPLPVEKKEPKRNPEEPPPGWVDDFTDPGMSKFRPESEQ